MTMLENEMVVLKSRPGENGIPKEEHFATVPCPFPSEALQLGEVIVKTLFLSVDPALRCRMNEDTGVHYMTPWQLGKCVEGLGGLGVIYQSHSSNFREGDIVSMAMSWPWQLYFRTNDTTLTKVDEEAVGGRISLYLSCLGLIGLTALLGIREKGNVLAGTGQTCVVSAAAGACGSLAGQIAKLDGCDHVIGICGSNGKCKLLEELGFGSAINYREGNIEQKLTELCPNGIQVYFDNVGGEISDAVIKQMTPNSHVILCGQISQYNKAVPYPPPVSREIEVILAQKNITRNRFLVINYAAKFDDGLKQLAQWLREGKLKVKETIEEGLKNTPGAFISMMSGGNIGKQLVHVADP